MCLNQTKPSRQYDVLLRTGLNLAQAKVLEKTTFIPSPLLFLMNNTLQRWTLRASTAGISTWVAVSSVLADNFAGPDPSLPGTPGSKGTDPEGYRQIIIQIITAALNFLALIAVVVIIIAGIRLILSQGEDEVKEKAKKTIFFALAGLAIVLFARVIVGLITNYLATQVGG